MIAISLFLCVCLLYDSVRAELLCADRGVPSYLGVVDVVVCLCRRLLSELLSKHCSCFSWSVRRVVAAWKVCE